MKKKVLIKVTPAKVGFLTHLGRLLAEDCDVTFITNKPVARRMMQIAPDFPKTIDTSLDEQVEIDDELLISECVERERRYGENFSLIMSHERGLGKGYLFNADLHPDLKRGWWSHTEKLRVVLSQFKSYERIFSKHEPDLVIGMYIEKVLNLVCRFNEVLDLSLVNARSGDRYFWTENGYAANHNLFKDVANYVENPHLLKDFPSDAYEQVKVSQIVHKGMDYSYRSALITAFRRFRKGIYSFLRTWGARIYRRNLNLGKRNPGRGARNLGWYKPILKRPAMYRYFTDNGFKLAEIPKEIRLIYIPLHLEPEVALLSVSPEFNNSWEMISWVSKSAPADMLLVVKEHPVSFGIRSKTHYDNLRRIPNVVLAHPDVHPWDWIGASHLTATITGTAAVEAIHVGKPVLSFGRHQVVNLLPTVRFAYDYRSTLQGLTDLLALKACDPLFEQSRKSLSRAQKDNSFDFPGIEYPNLSGEEEEKLAEIATRSLKKFYPRFFRLNG